MIQILPITNGLFERDLTKKELKAIEVNHMVYITDLTLISKLMTIKSPIKNTRIFLNNILSFLSYLETLIDVNGTQNNIPKDVFVSYFSVHNYKYYQEILSELNILTNVPHKDGTWYQMPSKDKMSICKSYRIHNDYLRERELCIVILEEPRKKYDRIISIDDRLVLDKRYIKTIDSIEINIKNAIDAEIKHCIDNKLSSSILRNRISRIFYTKQKRFIKQGKKVDRVYHSFTNLSKITRKHLNRDFNYIDITNCQPLLLSSYLMSNNLPIDINYKNDCEFGNFYEEFYSLEDNKDVEETRKLVKKSIYKNLFFGFNDKNIYNQKFRELYPSTWSSLKDISKTNVSLASRLQNLEAELFNNIIPTRSEYYFTLFDAIYFSDVLDIPEINNIIKNFFNNLGVNVITELG